jgi:hypothetical protein
MANGTPETRENRNRPGGLDPEEFGRKVRQFASDTHRILKSPNSPVEDLIRLRRRARSLLHEAQRFRSTEIHRWLREMWRAIEAKLPPGPVEDRELSVT